MPVFDNGEDQAAGGAGLRFKTVQAFHNVPPVVLAAFARCALNMHFLVFVLPHVGNKKIAGLPVKREAPGVPKAQGPDLRKRPLLPDKGVGGRNAVGFHL